MSSTFTESTNAIYMMKLESTFADIKKEVFLHTQKDLRTPIFKLIEDKNRWGYWSPSDRVLAINVNLFRHYESGAVDHVLKHEVAHQIVSEIFDMDCYGVAHGEAFKRACLVVNVAHTTCASHELLAGFKGKSEDRIVNKIRKIMELASDGNFEEEADTALMKAQELMARYNVSMQDVTGSEKVFVKRPFGDNYKSFPTWLFRIGNFLNDQYGVKCIQTWGPSYTSPRGYCKNTKRLELYGEPDRLNIAEYVGHAIINQGTILYEAFKLDHQERMKTDYDYQLNNGYRKISKRAFMEGLIAGYSRKMNKNQRNVEAKIESEDGAIVPAYNEKLLGEMYGTAYGRTRTIRNASSGGGGRSAGDDAGSSLTISSGVTSSGNRGRLLS